MNVQLSEKPNGLVTVFNLPRIRKGMFPTILTKLIPHALTSPSEATIPMPAANTPQNPMKILLAVRKKKVCLQDYELVSYPRTTSIIFALFERYFSSVKLWSLFSYVCYNHHDAPTNCV